MSLHVHFYRITFSDYSEHFMKLLDPDIVITEGRTIPTPADYEVLIYPTPSKAWLEASHALRAVVITPGQEYQRKHATSCPIIPRSASITSITTTSIQRKWDSASFWLLRNSSFHSIAPCGGMIGLPDIKPEKPFC